MADLGALFVATLVAAVVSLGLGAWPVACSAPGGAGGSASPTRRTTQPALCTSTRTPRTPSGSEAVPHYAPPVAHSSAQRPARLVVLVSGTGTNLQALLDACADPAYGAEVVAVGADRVGIAGLARAERAGVPTFVHRVKDYDSRDDWDAALTESVAAYAPDLVVLGRIHEAGRGRRSSRRSAAGSSTPTPPCCRRSRACTGRATRSRYGVKVTGATLFVVDAGVDTGAIVAQVAVPVEDDDDEETLHERIKVAERAMLVDSVGRMARDGFTIDGRKVRFGGRTA